MPETRASKRNETRWDRKRGTIITSRGIKHVVQVWDEDEGRYIDVDVYLSGLVLCTCPTFQKHVSCGHLAHARAFLRAESGDAA